LIPTLLFIAGVGLFIAGIAMLSTAAAMIVGGLILSSFASLFEVRA